MIHNIQSNYGRLFSSYFLSVFRGVARPILMGDEMGKQNKNAFHLAETPRQCRR